ncbi:MAG: hypothetical protein V8S34_08825 [Lawsonibacter sp.]
MELITMGALCEEAISAATKAYSGRGPTAGRAGRPAGAGDRPASSGTSRA